METPASWLTSGQQHPAAQRQHTWTPSSRVGPAEAYGEHYSEAAAMRPSPSVIASRTLGYGAQPWAMSERGAGEYSPAYGSRGYAAAPAYPAPVYTDPPDRARELYDDGYGGGGERVVGVDELAFGAPGLAEAMVHQEASLCEAAEQRLDEERQHCELLKSEIQRLQVQLMGGADSWKCPICRAAFPRAEKDLHGRDCLKQFVEYVQTGAPEAAGR